MTQANLSMKKKQTHRQRGQTCSCQRGGGRRGTGWEFGISRCTVLDTEWISNRYCRITENYGQHPAINQNGKQHEQEYICMIESFCCIPETNTL